MSLHIEGRRWFQRTYGNTYHSVRIFENGAEIAASGKHYGYGDQYLQTALSILADIGRIPKEGNPCASLYLRETLGASYSVIDVTRERDL